MYATNPAHPRPSRILVSLLIAVALCFGVAGVNAQTPVASTGAGPDADAPEQVFRGQKLDKEAYMLQREVQLGYWRGIDPEKPFDPRWRQESLLDLEIASAIRGAVPPHSWTELGPMPIPNGQGAGTVSGRTISIAIHPSNPDIVYVGTASGGLYRSTNGGTSWMPMMDNALNLSIGALALAPSQPDTLYVGTGEPNFSLDSFFGVGMYRIDNASTGSPTISGPFNQDSGAADVFSGRAISAIRVHPTDANTIFLSTTSGVAGIGGVQGPNLPSRGVYRSTNATSATPTFEKLTGLAGNANSSVRDMVIDPSNANFLVAGVVATGGSGGIYVSTDALGANPSFTQRVVFNGASTNDLTAEFAIHSSGAGNPTVYAAVGDGGGRVLINTDGGTTWTQQIDNNFCTPQCFYDIAVAVAPNDPTRVYLAGAPAFIFGFSTNSGTSFTQTGAGVHVDSHVIAVSESNPNVLYFGTDGGIHRSNNSGSSFISLNNDTFSATQFQSMAVHPFDLELMIGGTQDNGTNLKRADGSWIRNDFGDGGFSGIDDNAQDTNTVRMYHTYFNAVSLQGYGTTNSTATMQGGWAFRGCQNFGTTVNGINCTGTILFYAPLVLGPGNPNTVYYGSDRLYRSDDTGLTHSVVSQNPLVSGVPISAIGISPTNDNVRAVGLRDGSVFRTATGSNTLDLVDAVGGGTIPDFYVSRIVIDANNNNVAYVTLAGFPGAGQSIWKSTNFLSPNPTWASAAAGIPNVPVNVMVIHPDDSNLLYAGSDIGVYRSDDAGASWSPFSDGLPRVPVFGMAFQGPENVQGPGPLRIATHGRGIWEVSVGDAGLIFADSLEDL